MQMSKGKSYLWYRSAYSEDHSGICLVSTCFWRVANLCPGQLWWLQDHYNQLSIRVHTPNTRIFHCRVSWMAEFAGRILGGAGLGVLVGLLIALEGLHDNPISIVLGFSLFAAHGAVVAGL